MKEHTLETNLMYECDVCNKRFTQMYNLRAHKKHTHWRQNLRK